MTMKFENSIEKINSIRLKVQEAERLADEEIPKIVKISKEKKEKEKQGCIHELLNL